MTVNKSYRVLDYLPLTANTRIIFETADYSPGHIVEAGVDKFFVSGSLTSIAEKHLSTNTINVFPNPFNNNFNVEFTNLILPNSYIQIVDISGRVVFEQQIYTNSGIIQLSPDLNRGIYFLRLNSDGNILATEKLVKQ